MVLLYLLDRERHSALTREPPMILVVGATGLVGGEVCHRLAAREIPTRAMVRATSDPAKVEALRELGIEVVEGDLRDPASLTEACRDVSAVIDTVSSMPFAYEPGVNDITTTDLEGALRLIDADRAAAWSGSSTRRSPGTSTSTSRSATRSARSRPI
jgi:nucleoside-diphosphate-sugar epimerase